MFELTPKRIVEAGRLCGLQEVEQFAALGEVLKQKLWQFLVDLMLETMERKEGANWAQAEIDYFKRGVVDGEGFADFITQLRPSEHLEVIDEIEDDGEDVEESDLAFRINLFVEFARKKLAGLEKEGKAKKKAGRPKQEALRAFVLALALNFEKFSRRRFTFDRYRNSRGQYEPLTMGHRFVWTIVSPIIPKLEPKGTVTDTAVAMECERAVKWLRNLRKHNRAKAEKSR